VGGDLTFLNGDGDNTTVLQPLLGTGSVGGDLRIVNSFGSDTTAVWDTNVGDDVRIDNGGNDPDANFTGTVFGALSTPAPVTVGGDVVFCSRGGVVSNQLSGTTVGGDVTFDASGPGEVTHGIGLGFAGGTTTVGGDVTVRGAGGPVRVTLGAPPFSFSDGPALVIDGHLSVVSGAADDEVDLSEVQVGRTTSLTTGDGADAVTIDDTVFAAAFNLTTGSGDDVVRVEGQRDPSLADPTDFRGQVTVDLGQGDFNGDGWLDLAVGNQEVASVSILLNTRLG